MLALEESETFRLACKGENGCAIESFESHHSLSHPEITLCHYPTIVQPCASRPLREVVEHAREEY